MAARAALVGALLACCTPPIAGQGVASGAKGFEIVGASFVAIVTEDVEAAASWYVSTFGLAAVNHIESADGDYSIRLLSGGGLTVELLQLSEAAPAPDRHLGLFKAGFYVTDIAAAHRWLVGKGVDTDPSVFVDSALRARSFVFRDLDGNRLQVFQRCGEQC